jgi:DNA topoisomerase-2
MTVLRRWEVLVGVSDGRFQQVSFVNSIATTKGGTHVNYVVDQLCKHIVTVVSKVGVDICV